MRPLCIFTALLFVLFASLSAQQTFTDVTAQMGISGQSGLGHSVGWCDIDNDRDLDVALSNQNDDGFWLYRNDDSTFADITSQAGLSALTAYRIIWAEVTGDTFSDLIVRTWGAGQKLYKNNGNNSFTDISGSSGVSGHVVAAADFDNNGASDLLSLTSTSCYILYNNGSGVFSSSQFVGYSNDFQNAVCFDYNLDGNVDIYLGTYGDNPNKLFKNFGSDSFADVTAYAGVEWTGGTSGITCGDYDNDGFPDLYLGNTSSPGCKLFHNEGNGTFTDVTTSAGVTGHTDTRTVIFVDYNNDGNLDIFVSNHDFYVYSNQMYRNNGNGTFTDVGAQLNLSGQMVGDYFGTGWGDFNNDGAIDLFAVGHIDKYVLFRNDNCPGNYLNARLIGTVSNYNGIGAKAEAFVGSQCLTRFVVAGEGMHDFHSFPVELGLDNSNSIDSLAISWPSGIIQTLYSVNANQFITIVENETGSVEKQEPRHEIADIRPLCQPNPFTSIVEIDPGMYDAECTMYVTSLKIYDVSGRLVKNLPLGTGYSVYGMKVIWNGKNNEGEAVRPGVYFVKVNDRYTAKLHKIK